MKLRLLFSFLLISLCFYPTNYAIADEVIPWLTGHFEVFGSSYFAVGGGTFVMDQGSGNTSFDAILDTIKTQYCDNDPCTQGYWHWSGPVTGGSLTIGILSAHGSPNFSGTITGGSLLYHNEVFGWCDSDCITEEFDFGFIGTWDTGWTSTGRVWFGTDDGLGYGYLDIKTVTPEPGTIALLVPGIIGLWSVMHRKLSR